MTGTRYEGEMEDLDGRRMKVVHALPVYVPCCSARNNTATPQRRIPATEAHDCEL